MSSSDSPSTLPRILLALTGLFAVAAAGLAVAGPEGTPLIAALLAWAALCAAVIAGPTRTGVLITACGAFAANAYLFSLKFAASGEALCNINDVLNCAAVNNSEYSEAFGIPITLMGMAFYAGLACASLFSPERTPRFYEVTGAFALASVAYSVFLGAVSASMGHLCIVCISIYIANVLLLWAAYKGRNPDAEADFKGTVTSRSFLTICAGFVAVMLVGGSAWSNRTASDLPQAHGSQLSTDALAKMYTAPMGPLKLDGSEPTKGPRDAPYLLVEFADFGCPHCARAEKEIQTLASEFSGLLQVKFKVFPLTGACNASMQNNPGPERCFAAWAAECANQQGKFWDYAASVFRNQRFLAMEDLTFQAEELGLDMTRFNTCVGDPQTAKSVLADGAAGHQAGVRGTPTLFLRGVTSDDQFVTIAGGPGAVRKLIEAHQAGIELPAAAPMPAQH